MYLCADEVLGLILLVESAAPVFRVPPRTMAGWIHTVGVWHCRIYDACALHEVVNFRHPLQYALTFTETFDFKF